jgi:hypothetical protein
MKRRGFFSFLTGLVAAPVVAKVLPAPVVADPPVGGIDAAVYYYWTSSPYGAAAHYEAHDGFDMTDTEAELVETMDDIWRKYGTTTP